LSGSQTKATGFAGGYLLSNHGEGYRRMARKGGSFKNIKLGKNVFRQIKRRGSPGRTSSQKQIPKK
jgi:hypothetical protein